MSPGATTRREEIPGPLRSFLEMGFKLKWPQKYEYQGVGIRVIGQTLQVLFTLEEIQGEFDFHLLDLGKLFIGPVSLKRLRFTPDELSNDNTDVIIGQ